MAEAPRLDPQLEKAFLTLVKERYDGDLQRAMNRAIEYFIFYEQQADNAQSLIGKVNDIRAKIKDLREINNETTKYISEIKDKKKGEQS